MAAQPSREEEHDRDYSYMQRVKVYKLNEQGTWDDKGTGHVSVEYMEQSDAAGLVVISEEDTSTLLIHRISLEDIYQRQGADTIISWLDPEIGTDIALSFQETPGCNFIWEQIAQVQRQNSSGKNELAGARRSRVVDEFDVAGVNKDDENFQDAEGNNAIELPAPELGHLPEIVKILTEVASPYARERIANSLQKKGYLRKLLDLFRLCEDVEDMEGLVLTYKAVKGIMLLNDAALFEYLLRPECVMDVVGALEYDPEFLPKKQNHRSYLQDSVVFKEVVPIACPEIRNKIHQTYRIGYVKDVILARVLDDATFATLSSLILFNNVEIVLSLQNDPNFFKELFDRLRTLNPSHQDWQDLIAFLQELTSVAKHLQPGHKATLFSSLIRNGLFNVLTVAVNATNTTTCLRASDILLASLQHDPSTLRGFLHHQPKHELLSLLVDCLVRTDDDGVQEQTLEILRTLLDPESMETVNDKTVFLEVFYEKYVDKVVGVLADCLTTTAGPSGEGLVKRPSASTLGLIVELLSFCVKNHSYRIKYYVLRNNVVTKVLRLTHRPEKFLVVAAVRFLRTCIGLKDEFYHRHLIKNNLFQPVIDVFVANGDKYNLLNSVVIELVDFIRKENIKSLIAHLMENFSSSFEKIDYVETFQQLKQRYEQQQEGQRPGASNYGAEAGPQAAGPRHHPLMPGVSSGMHPSYNNMHPGGGMVAGHRRDARAMDKDEEDYFNNEDDDDDDDSSHPSTNPNGVRLHNENAPSAAPLLDLAAKYGPGGDDRHMFKTEVQNRGSTSSGSSYPARQEPMVGPMPTGANLGKRPMGQWMGGAEGLGQGQDHGKRPRQEDGMDGSHSDGGPTH